MEESIKRSIYIFDTISIQTYVVGMTVFFVSFALGVDVYTHHPIHLWLIILAVSAVLQLFALFIKYKPVLVVIVISVFLISSSLYILFFQLFEFNRYLIPQIILMSLYVVSMLIFFWRLIYISFNEKILIETKIKSNRKLEPSKESRKERKRRRRENSKEKLGTAVKSGKYRGWWTGY